jgi:hypothetical protein
MTKIHSDVPATFRRAQLLHFIRHFLEMVIAMVRGWWSWDQSGP